MRIEKDANGVSAFASPLHTSTPQPVDLNSRIHIDWSSNSQCSQLFTGQTYYGFAAFSQAMASFRNIKINQVETCAIEP